MNQTSQQYNNPNTEVESLTKESGRINPVSPLHWLWIGSAILFILYAIGHSLNRIRIPKKKLVDAYGVDKKTFNKWLKFFCADLVPDMQAYYKKRTVTFWQYHALKKRLGNPLEYPALTKKDILEKGEGTYYTLRGCVERYNSKHGLFPSEAYISLKKFPPNISQLIMVYFE